MSRQDIEQDLVTSLRELQLAYNRVSSALLCYQMEPNTETRTKYLLDLRTYLVEVEQHTLVARKHATGLSHDFYLDSKAVSR